MKLYKYLLFCWILLFSISSRSWGEIKNPDTLLELTRQKAKETDALLKQIEEDNEIMAKYVLLLFSNPPEKLVYNPNIYTFDEKGVYGDHQQKSQTSVWFKGKSGSLPEEVIKQIRATESMEKRYKELKKRYDYIKWIYLITAEGVIRVYPREAKAKYPGDSDPRESRAYVLASPEKNPQRYTIWTEPYKDSQEKWMVTCSTPLYERGTFLGVQALDITVDELKDKVLKVKAGKTSIALLIDKKGNILAQTSYPKGDKKEESFSYTHLAAIPDESIQGIIEKISEGREGVVNLNIKDQRRYFAFVPVKTPGWIYGIISKI
jgi:hypothetical protein